MPLSAQENESGTYFGVSAGLSDRTVERENRHCATRSPQVSGRWVRLFVRAACVGLVWFLLDHVISRVTSSTQPLRVAINPWPGYGPAYLARHLNGYQKRGLDVRLIEYDSLSANCRAFERDQVDMFFGTIGDVLHTAQHCKRRPRIVLVTDYSNGADIVIGRPSIRSLADLRNGRIGIEANSLGALVASLALESAGMQLSDVELCRMHYGELKEALATGEVDAVVTYPPDSFEVLQEMQGNELFSTAQIPGEVVDVMAVASDVLEERPQEVVRFLEAFFDAQDFATAHPEEAAQLIARQLKMSASDVQQTLDGQIHVVTRNEQPRFLGTAGTLSQQVQRVDLVLHSIGELVHPSPDYSMVWCQVER